MKIVGIVICKKSAPKDVLAQSFDLSQFGFFQRSSAQEFMTFSCTTMIERTASGQRQSLTQKEQNANIHAFTHHSGISAAILTSLDYPTRVAYTILSKVIDEYAADFPGTNKPTGGKWGKLDEMVVRYQDPKAADPLMRVQSELDETKIILHKTIEGVLERGEKLDNLVAKSDQLSMASKTFYKSAKSTNSWCCGVM